jgi:carbon-monoxide dehydrogenase medium subunit
MSQARSVLTPGSSKEAAAAVVECAMTPLAGATWIMRAPLRGERLVGPFVLLTSLAEPHEIAATDTDIVIGAAVTHNALVSALQGLPDCRGPVEAARRGKCL